MILVMSHRRSFLATLGAAPVALSPAQTPDPPAPLDIFQAALKGDVARATELAKWNPAIARLRSADGRTPLHYAVEGGHPAMIMFLTIQGADLSAGPESPLLTAIDFHDRSVAAEMAQALLMNGSDPNLRRADGRSAIEVAQARGAREIVEMLVHRGAAGPPADSVKVERVYFGRRYSFDAQGRPYAPQDLDGLPQDFINEFARLAHFDAGRVKHLLRLAPSLAGARATWDESAIEAAAHMGLVPLARHLADCGAPVSTCTATALGLRDRVEALVGSEPACVRERGAHDIALIAYTALGEQQTAIAEFLLRSGASVHACALGNLTALHIAASKGYAELADVLIAHGADVNAAAQSRDGAVTPLALAWKAKQERTAQFLKSKGAR